MVLATEKLDVVVALVEVKIEVSAALRAFQIAGKHAGLLGDLGPLAAGAFGESLYLFPCQTLQTILRKILDTTKNLLYREMEKASLTAGR